MRKFKSKKLTNLKTSFSITRSNSSKRIEQLQDWSKRYCSVSNNNGKIGARLALWVFLESLPRTPLQMRTQSLALLSKWTTIPKSCKSLTPWCTETTAHQPIPIPETRHSSLGREIRRWKPQRSSTITMTRYILVNSQSLRTLWTPRLSSVLKSTILPPQISNRKIRIDLRGKVTRKLALARLWELSIEQQLLKHPEMPHRAHLSAIEGTIRTAFSFSMTHQLD